MEASKRLDGNLRVSRLHPNQANDGETGEFNLNKANSYPEKFKYIREVSVVNFKEYHGTQAVTIQLPVEPISF